LPLWNYEEGFACPGGCLFDVVADPGEVLDAGAQNPAVVAAMRVGLFLADESLFSPISERWRSRRAPGSGTTSGGFMGPLWATTLSFSRRRRDDSTKNRSPLLLLLLSPPARARARLRRMGFSFSSLPSDTRRPPPPVVSAPAAPPQPPSAEIGHARGLGRRKTQLLLRYVKDRFIDPYNTTMGFDFLFKRLCVDGRDVKLMLWDTAGHER